MAGTALTYSPADGEIVSSVADLDLVYSFTPGVADVEIAVWVNAARVAFYSGGTLTPIAGYSGSVTVQGDRITIHLVKTTGWNHNTPVAWYSTYEDASTALSTTATRKFVYATVLPNTLVPTELDDLVPSRPTLYLSFDFSLGTGVGVDLVVDGIPAREPDFIVQTGGGSTRSYVQCTPRKAFRTGQRVTVVAAPRVLYSGTVYYGAYTMYFTPQTLVTPTVETNPFAGPFTSVLGEGLRRLIATYLVVRPTSPGLRAVVVWMLHHSMCGALVRGTFALQELGALDLPSAEQMSALVAAATPLWPAALNQLAPRETRDALDEIWRQNNLIERVACLCVLVAYGSGEVR